MRRAAAYLALLAMAPLLLGGCVAASVVPMAAIAATGAYKAADAARPISDSEEYYVGRAVAARIFSKYPLSQDAKLTAYVNEVG